MEHFGLTQRFLLTAIAGGAFGTLASAIWWFVRRDDIRNLPPTPRLRRLVIVASLPVLGAFGLLSIAVLPSILDATGFIADHCGAHPSHHVHLCPLHTTHAHSSSLAWLGIGAGIIWLACRTVPTIGARLRATRSLSSLADASSPNLQDEDNVRVVPSERPFAATVGLFAPRVLISDALASALSTSEYEVVTAHEAVHADRYHPLLQTAIDLVGLLHLPPVRTFLTREVELACEQIADRRAARHTDAVDVADTILTVERMMRDDQSRPPVTPSIDGSTLEHRVVGLLEEPWQRSTTYLEPIATAALAVIVASSYATIHHGLETLFSLLFG